MVGTASALRMAAEDAEKAAEEKAAATQAALAQSDTEQK